MENKEKLSDKEREPLERRFPFLPWFRFLEKKWKQEFGTLDRLTTKTSFGEESFFTPYNINWPVLGIVLEEAGNILQQRNPQACRNSPIFFQNPTGKVILRPDATEQDFQKAQKSRALRGIKILCVAGPDGRVFADFGATVVNVDPLIEQAVPKTQENLIEIPNRFQAQKTQSQLKKHGRFDISFSCWFFDRGSGLDPIFRFAFTPIPDSELAIYYQTIQEILKFTRHGGASIHNGNMLALLTNRDLQLPSHQVELPYSQDTPEKSTAVFIFKT